MVIPGIEKDGVIVPSQEIPKEAKSVLFDGVNYIVTF